MEELHISGRSPKILHGHPYHGKLFDGKLLLPGVRAHSPNLHENTQDFSNMFLPQLSFMLPPRYFEPIFTRPIYLIFFAERD